MDFRNMIPSLDKKTGTSLGRKFLHSKFKINIYKVQVIWIDRLFVFILNQKICQS